MRRIFVLLAFVLCSAGDCNPVPQHDCTKVAKSADAFGVALASGKTEKERQVHVSCMCHADDAEVYCTPIIDGKPGEPFWCIETGCGYRGK
jgi:hypothetical protein